MLPKTVADYGGVYVDARPVKNPTCEVSAAKFNRLCEDVAQLTNPSPKALVIFTTSSGGAATYAAAAVTYRSVWGSSDSVKPAVAKTATGLYTVTFASSYTDGLGESETVGLIDANCSVRSTTLSPPPIVTALTSTVVSLTVQTTAGAASDLSGTAVVTVRVY